MVRDTQQRFRRVYPTSAATNFDMSRFGSSVPHDIFDRVEVKPMVFNYVHHITTVTTRVFADRIFKF